jgi:hypothetical protein
MSSPLRVQAMGRRSRQMCKVDKYGFSRTYAKTTKNVRRFQTGDFVKAKVTKGKKAGTSVRSVDVLKFGSFYIRTTAGKE